MDRKTLTEIGSLERVLFRAEAALEMVRRNQQDGAHPRKQISFELSRCHSALDRDMVWLDTRVIMSDEMAVGWLDWLRAMCASRLEKLGVKLEG